MQSEFNQSILAVSQFAKAAWLETTECVVKWQPFQNMAKTNLTLTSARVLSVTSMTNSGAGPLLSSSKKFKMSERSQGSLRYLKHNKPI